MSYIDTFDHEFVGFFGRRPIYHPLEEVIMEDEDSPFDFSCDPSQLVIGGGLGELPAIVIKRLDCAVVHFYTAWTIWLDELSDDKKQKYAKFNETLWDQKFDKYQDQETWDCLHFAGWQSKDYFYLYQESVSSAFYTPLKSGDSLEHWLLESMGEFIFFSMPELVPDLESDILELRQFIDIELYQNVLLPPPDYSIPAGRKIINDNLVWGQRWWKNPKNI